MVIFDWFTPLTLLFSTLTAFKTEDEVDRLRHGRQGMLHQLAGVPGVVQFCFSIRLAGWRNTGPAYVYPHFHINFAISLLFQGWVELSVAKVRLD